MSEPKGPRFVAGSKGIEDLVAERKKAIEGSFQALQKMCSDSFPQSTAEYWKLMTNTLFGWSREDLKFLIYQADKGIFSSRIKEEFLIGLILSNSIAKVGGKALFGPEELEILTGQTQ